MELAGSTLTIEEDYALETAGFLIVENALSPEVLFWRASTLQLAAVLNSDCAVN